MKGKVYLIGAGPGDPGLITKKGHDILTKADVIVYDRLVSPKLIDLAKPDAEFIYVGKSAKIHVKTQDEINEIIYRQAEMGKIVARLKGGDPYVFGRGGEEGEYLIDRGIEFETVPGVTSAIGGLAYAGIPITHRGVATSFHVITGHLKSEDDELNWEALAKLDGTMVFLMGVSNLGEISKNLIANGKDPKTPVGIINWATTHKQKVVEGPLDEIYEIALKNQVKPPSLIAIGDVVALREKLKFQERKPLFGKNIVVTRGRNHIGETVDKLEGLGANVVTLPMIEVKPVEDKDILKSSIERLSDYNFLVFTSVNGVEIFFKELFQMGYDSRKLGGLKLASVGPKTSAKLREYGINPDIEPERYVAEDLAEEIKKYVCSKDKVLAPRGNLSRPILVEELSKICQVDEVIIYDTVRTDTGEELIEERLEDLDDYYLLFTSSSTFNNFNRAIGDKKDIIRKGKVLSIGPITTRSILDAGYEIYREADKYTIDGVIDILLKEE